MAPLAKSDKQPVSRLWYMLALVVFLLCTTGVIVTAYKAIKAFPEGAQFSAPGSLTFTVRQPGEYVIWDEQVTFFNGRSYRSSEELPGGMQITVRDAQSGSALQLSPSSGANETIGNTRRKSIGTVLFDRPGNYTIEVAGSFPERVFYVRRSAASTVLSGIAISAAFGLIGWVLAPIAAIVVYVKRSGAHSGSTEQAGARPQTANPVPASPAPSSPAAPMDTEGERTHAMFCHLGALSGFVAPFGNIIVPLVLWLVKREASDFVDAHGKEALNFQISFMIYSLISAVLILALVGIFLLAALCIFDIVIVIIAGIKAKSGENFRYPLAIRFIR